MNLHDVLAIRQTADGDEMLIDEFSHYLYIHTSMIHSTAAHISTQQSK
jgi:hypothetical protein